MVNNKNSYYVIFARLVVFIMTDLQNKYHLKAIRPNQLLERYILPTRGPVKNQKMRERIKELPTTEAFYY